VSRTVISSTVSSIMQIYITMFYLVLCWVMRSYEMKSWGHYTHTKITEVPPKEKKCYVKVMLKP
jgi:hypothetical protein